jgi:hypothetical protein
MSDQIWVCRDGRKIPVKDMEDNHLIHAWRLFYKKKEKILDNFEQGITSTAMSRKLINIEKRLGMLIPEMIKRGMHE